MFLICLQTEHPCLKYAHITVMIMDCGLRLWTVIHSNTNGRQKITQFKTQFWKEDNSVALSVLLTSNSSSYEDFFVLPWVTELDKLSFCPYPHHKSSCWSFAISSTWSMCPLLEILQFFLSLHSTLLQHVPKRPPLFPTLNLWNMSCPSRHVPLASISDLSEVKKNTAQSSDCFPYTHSTTTFSGVSWHSCASYWKPFRWQVFQ